MKWEPQCDVCTRSNMWRKSLVWGVSVYRFDGSWVDCDATSPCPHGTLPDGVQWNVCRRALHATRHEVHSCDVESSKVAALLLHRPHNYFFFSSFATTTFVLLVALLGPTVPGSMSPLTTIVAETRPFVFALALAALAAVPVLAALACKALALAFLELAGATLWRDVSLASTSIATDSTLLKEWISSFSFSSSAFHHVSSSTSISSGDLIAILASTIAITFSFVGWYSTNLSACWMSASSKSVSRIEMRMAAFILLPTFSSKSRCNMKTLLNHFSMMFLTSVTLFAFSGAITCIISCMARNGELGE